MTQAVNLANLASSTNSSGVLGTAVQKSGDTMTGALTLASTSSIVDASGYKYATRIAPYNDTGQLRWSKLGRITNTGNINGFGGSVDIRMTGGSGFNARPEQAGSSEIHIWGSNWASAGPAVGGRFFSNNQTSTASIRAVKLVSVNGIQQDGAYDLWVYSTFYTPNGWIDVTTSGFTWAWASDYGTLTTTSPGAGSNTIRDLNNKFPAYGAQAYVTFNGHNAAISSGMNIASVTRDSTANYTITFSEAMLDSSYTIHATASFYSGTNGDVRATVNDEGGSPGTGFVRIRCNTEPDFCYVTIFSNF